MQPKASSIPRRTAVRAAAPAVSSAQSAAQGRNARAIKRLVHLVGDAYRIWYWQAGRRCTGVPCRLGAQAASSSRHSPVYSKVCGFGTKSSELTRYRPTGGRARLGTAPCSRLDCPLCGRTDKDYTYTHHAEYLKRPGSVPLIMPASNKGDLRYPGETELPLDASGHQEQ